MTFLKAHPSHADQIEGALDLILIARNLERLGDHATNIAEDVILFIRERTFAMVESTPKSQEAKALPAQVLVVEDEAEIRELIALLLLRQGYRVQQCSNAFEASDVLRRNQYDLVVLDWMLPQMSGIEFLKSLQRDGQSQTRPRIDGHG